MRVTQKLRLSVSSLFIGFLVMGLGCEKQSTIYELEEELSIEIVQPLDGETIEGTIVIKAVIGATTNIEKLMLLLDGQEYAQSATAEWKTTFYLDGVHELKGLIIDASGNEIYSDPVNVTLHNSSDVNVNVIEEPDFESPDFDKYLTPWHIHKAFRPSIELRDNTRFIRLWAHDSFISQPLEAHFETGQQFRLTFWYKANDSENSSNTLRIGYRNEEGRRQSLSVIIDAKLDWQFFEYDISPPLAAGEFTELRLDAIDIDLDDVGLVREK